MEKQQSIIFQDQLLQENSRFKNDLIVYFDKNTDFTKFLSNFEFELRSRVNMVIASQIELFQCPNAIQNRGKMQYFQIFYIIPFPFDSCNRLRQINYFRVRQHITIQKASRKQESNIFTDKHTHMHAYVLTYAFVPYAIIELEVLYAIT